MIALFSSLRRLRASTGASILALAVGMALPTFLSAQGGPPTSGSSTRGSRERAAQQSRGIEEQLQHRIAAMLRERLGFTDEQLRRLEDVTRRLDPERRRVRSEEFRLRTTMRRIVLAKDSSQSDTLAVLLSRMPAVERRKIDLMEAEQRELAQFLSPLQRAQFLALQDEIMRGMEEIRQRRGSSNGSDVKRPDTLP